MAALSFALALFLRLGEAVLQYEPQLMVLYGAVFTGVAAVVFLVTGLYRGIWRYASLPDLFNIARAATLTELIFLPVMVVLTRRERLPRLSFLIGWLGVPALLGGPPTDLRSFKKSGLRFIVARGPKGHRGQSVS